MFEAITGKIKVQVQPKYIEDESAPARDYYFFSYRVRIINEGDEQVQLLSRRWTIKDAYGSVEQVEGEGVVGVQPTLKPGDTFEYSSFCPLQTPTGSMQGSYFMVDSKGRKIEVEIPSFILAEPKHYH